MKKIFTLLNNVFKFYASFKILICFFRKLEIFSGETLLNAPIVIHDPEQSLAKIGVELLTVAGCLRASTAIQANAFLENVVLDDCR